MGPTPVSEPQALRRRFDAAFADIAPPFAFVDLDALETNARDLLDQAGDLSIRVASKSVRSVAVLHRIFALDGRFQGVLSFTLREALHLHDEGFRDVFVGYPTTDAAALDELAALAAKRPADHPALIVDSTEHLDLIDRAVGPGGAAVRVAIDIDTSWWLAGGRVRIGPKRSPVRTPTQAAELAGEIARRPTMRLVGAMGYEGHIAGVGDRVPGRPVRSAAIRAMQKRSLAELRERLPLVVTAIETAAGPLEWVNCGGTGSLERSGALGVATELTAGSGFYAPALFDTYSGLDLRPAAGFCLPVTRRPQAGVATVLGGGYVASGAPGADRLPAPWLPPGLALDRDEGAGEVQTPLRGDPAAELAIGDRVYLRHAKAGELFERFDHIHLLQGERVVERAASYRGSGHAFL